MVWWILKRGGWICFSRQILQAHKLCREFPSTFCLRKQFLAYLFFFDSRSKFRMCFKINRIWSKASWKKNPISKLKCQLEMMELKMWAWDGIRPVQSPSVGGVRVVTCLRWLNKIHDKQLYWCSLIPLEDGTQKRIIEVAFRTKAQNNMENNNFTGGWK